MSAIAPGATDTERLLVLASLAAPDADERAELHELAHKLDDWAGLLELADVNATVPLVHHRLEHEDLFSLMPPPVQAGFDVVSSVIADANDRRLAGAMEVLGRFDAAGIECVVLKGMLRVTHRGGTLDVHAGQAVIAQRGEWVRYSTPDPEGAEYLAVCLPAFSPATVHRDDS